MGEIGIVTWYKNGNYGGTLQAYALMKTLQKYNHNVEFINYDKTNALKGKVRDIGFHLLYPKSALSRDRIYKFIKKHFNQSPKFSSCNEITSYAEKYDAVICGSDQIWSSLNGVDPVYFLQFVSENKRIAYAPSIGVPNIPDKYIVDFNYFVKAIPHLSIREKQGAEYVKEIAGVEPKHVLDPTFLLNRQEWEEVASDKVIKQKKIVPHKYILCYFLGEDKKYEEYVNKFAKQQNLPVYYISSKRKNYKEKQLVCNPFEFIGLLKESACVITDSFHGLVLSINLGVRVGVFKRFNQYDAFNQNSRISSILELFGCENLLVDENGSCEDLLAQKPLSKTTLDKIEEKRKESIAYLLTALAGKGE